MSAPPTIGAAMSLQYARIQIRKIDHFVVNVCICLPFVYKQKYVFYAIPPYGRRAARSHIVIIIICFQSTFASTQWPDRTHKSDVML